MAGAGREPPASEEAWVELAVRLPLADAELVTDALGTIAAGGVALEPRIRTLDERDFAYELEPDEAVVRAFLAGPLTGRERRALRRRLAALPLSDRLPRLRYRAVEEQDWSQAWREHFTTLRIGRVVVRPSWEPSLDDEDVFEITLDPGRAFGTGQHPTTRLCLAAIERRLVPGSAVLDVGCGSGVLALAAARLGAGSVDALDVDPEAVRVARENVARNSLEGRVRVAEGSLAALWPENWLEPDIRFDLVTANISSAVVPDLLPHAAAALREGGILVLSGFMHDRVGEVTEAALAAGLSPIDLECDDEWCALVLERRA